MEAKIVSADQAPTIGRNRYMKNLFGSRVKLDDSSARVPYSADDKSTVLVDATIVGGPLDKKSFALPTDLLIISEQDKAKLLKLAVGRVITSAAADHRQTGRF